jgi:DNA-binding transcriptional MerR regulator
LPNKPEYLTIKNTSKILELNPERLMRWGNIGQLKTKRHPMTNYRICNPAEIKNLKKAIVEGKSE